MRPNCVSRLQWLQYNTLFFLEHFLGHERHQRIFGNTERKLFQKIALQAQNRPKDRTFKILEYGKTGHPQYLGHPYFPVVYRGVAKDWPSDSMWDLDYFAKEYGEVEVTLLNNPGLVGKSDQHNETVTLREYIELLKKGTSKYLKFSRLIHDNSRLRKYFDQNWLSRFKTFGSFGELFFFFIGGGGSLTPIHNGFAHTIFVQVKGSKKWVFYAPEDRIFLGARPERTSYNFSNGDIYNFNDPDYPLMKHATPYEVIVNEGDVIYFPPWVWHQVENIDDTIGVAYKFADLMAAARSSKILTFLYFFSTNPPLFNSTAHLWKEKKAASSKEGYGTI